MDDKRPSRIFPTGLFRLPAGGLVRLALAERQKGRFDRLPREEVLRFLADVAARLRR